MERLSLVAYRIVWVNPRTKSAGYQPLAGGMAAAWPHCDAVVSAHTLDALDDLADALADPVRRRPRCAPAARPPPGRRGPRSPQPEPRRARPSGGRTGPDRDVASASSAGAARRGQPALVSHASGRGFFCAACA